MRHRLPAGSEWRLPANEIARMPNEIRPDEDARSLAMNERMLTPAAPVVDPDRLRAFVEAVRTRTTFETNDDA
jgi:hypothetical protein